MTPRGRFGGRRTDELTREPTRRRCWLGTPFRLVTARRVRICPPLVLVEKAGAERIDEGYPVPRACRSTSRSARRSASMGFPGRLDAAGGRSDLATLSRSSRAGSPEDVLALGQSEKVPRAGSAAVCETVPRRIGLVEPSDSSESCVVLRRLKFIEPMVQKRRP